MGKRKLAGDAVQKNPLSLLLALSHTCSLSLSLSLSPSLCTCRVLFYCLICLCVHFAFLFLKFNAVLFYFQYPLFLSSLFFSYFSCAHSHATVTCIAYFQVGSRSRKSEGDSQCNCINQGGVGGGGDEGGKQKEGKEQSIPKRIEAILITNRWQKSNEDKENKNAECSPSLLLSLSLSVSLPLFFLALRYLQLFKQRNIYNFRGKRSLTTL